MGFGSAPKQPKTDPELARLQKQSLQASIDQAEKKQPALKLPEPVPYVAPGQQTAADQAAAERLAKQSMANKKGLQWSMNPGALGGGATL